MSNIFFEEGSSDLEIGAFAFYQCNTHNVVFSSNVSSIGAHAFSNGSLTAVNLNDNIKSIGNYAFQHNPGIKTFHIPDKLETLRAGILWGSPDIEEFTINTDGQGNAINPYYRVNNGFVTYHKDGQNTIAYATKDANPMNAQGVDSIYDYAFAGHEFTEVRLPECINSLGTGVFYGCKQLEKVTTEGLQQMNQMAFYECDKLSEVTLNDGFKNIGTYAFGSCKSLERLALPSSLESIEQGAFYDCTALKDLIINNNIQSVDYCVNNARALRYSIYENGKYLGNESNPYLVLIGVVDGVGVDKDTNEPVLVNTSATLNIHPNTKVVAQFAVGTQSGFDNKIEVINVPESVEYINVGAFTYSYALKNINIESSEGKIHGQAPWGANSLPVGSETRPDVVVTYNYKE